MRQLWLKIRNSEYLSDNEYLAIKVSVVLVFLMILGAISIPINVILSAQTWIQVFIPLSFIFTFLVALGSFFSNKPRLSMHFSLYALFILGSSYFTLSSPIYIYLLIFAILSVVIYFQDAYTFFTYGSILTIFGIAYMFFNIEDLSIISFQSSDALQIIIYQATLISFYVFFLLYFINSEIANERFINEYNRSKAYTKEYFDKITSLKKVILEQENDDFLHNKNAFQQAVIEIATFVGEMNGYPAKQLQELAEFYIYLHDIDIDKALNNKNLKEQTRTYIQQLRKYLINNNNEYMNLSYDLAMQDKEGLEIEDESLESHLGKLFEFDYDRIIAFAFIYRFLKQEVSQFDKWNQFNSPVEHSEIKKMFQSIEASKFFTNVELSFFIDNEDLFKKIL